LIMLLVSKLHCNVRLSTHFLISFLKSLNATLLTANDEVRKKTIKSRNNKHDKDFVVFLFFFQDLLLSLLKNLSCLFNVKLLKLDLISKGN